MNELVIIIIDPQQFSLFPAERPSNFNIITKEKQAFWSQPYPHIKIYENTTVNCAARPIFSISVHNLPETRQQGHSSDRFADQFIKVKICIQSFLKMDAVQIYETESTQSWNKDSKKKNHGRKMRAYNWTQEEQKLYLSYIKQNVSDMRRQQTRRKRVFVFIAKIIKSRTPTQIKTHHQKLEKKYGTIENIIIHLEQMLYPNETATLPKNEKQMVLQSSSCDVKSIDIQCNLQREEEESWEQWLWLNEKASTFWSMREIGGIENGTTHLCDDSPLI